MPDATSAGPAAPAASPPLPPSSWRTIDQLAECVGGYCWQEERLFEMTGRWASDEGDPAIRVYCSEVSARHAGLAAQWRDRLPVRAGVDGAALVAAPPGLALALSALEGQPGFIRRLGGLVNVVLPRLLSTYRAHLDLAWPVNEAPVMEVLRLVDLTGDREVQRGQALVEQAMQGPGSPGPVGQEKLSEFCRELERSLGATRDIIPAASAS
jgi:hypothetical protein